MSSRKKAEKVQLTEEPKDVAKPAQEEAPASSSCLILSQLLLVVFGVIAIGLTIAFLLPIIKLQPWSDPALTLRLVQHQFSRVVDLNHEFGQAALEQAVLEGDVDSVGFLMTRRGIAIDYLRDEAALAPFHHIIDQGNEEMLKVVLKKFSAVDARDMLGYTALHWAAARPWVEGAKLLIQAGADVNKPSLYNDITAVHMAATGGSAEILQMLEEKGAKLDVKTTDGMSPLWMASLRAHSEAIKFFLDHNTETDIIDPLTGNTLLHLVASSGTVETFSMLHKTKGCADAITKRNKAGDTPFHIAVRKNSLEVASYIAEHGGAAFDQGSRKVGLVELAVTYDEPALLSFLIGLGADIKADYARLQEIASRHETNKVAEILAASNFAGAAGIKV